jgi:Zn-dependent M16 (insulinase) family peptidase
MACLMSLKWLTAKVLPTITMIHCNAFAHILRPYSTLKWEAPLSRFKQRLASGEDVFGQLLDNFLLNNNHRVTVITLPDTELAKKVEEKELKRIAEARGQMTTEEVRLCVAGHPLCPSARCPLGQDQIHTP